MKKKVLQYLVYVICLAIGSFMAEHYISVNAGIFLSRILPTLIIGTAFIIDFVFLNEKSKFYIFENNK